VRDVARALHRVFGLTLAGFLIIIGLTGSVIVFFNELDEWANPELLTVQPEANYADLIALRETFEIQDSDAHVYGIVFPKATDKAVLYYTEGAIDEKTGEYKNIEYDSIYANPYTGERLGERFWGDLSFDSKDLTTFIFFLHYSLVLPEDYGQLVMGIVALLFAFDCIVALYLTLPRLNSGRKGFIQRWKRSWLIKASGNRFVMIFDWHRASGLWIWSMLLIFAISGFSINMPRTYLAIMNKMTNYVDNEALPILEKPLSNPVISWAEAYALGQKYMQQQADIHDFSIERLSSLIYRRETGIYDYRVQSSLDLADKPSYGYTSIAIDAMTGKLTGVQLPTGQYAANTFTSWITALHQGRVFGLPYRILCSILGLTMVALTITGIVIWYRRRSDRRKKSWSANTGTSVLIAAKNHQ